MTRLLCLTQYSIGLDSVVNFMPEKSVESGNLISGKFSTIFPGNVAFFAVVVNLKLVIGHFSLLKKCLILQWFHPNNSKHSET